MRIRDQHTHAHRLLTTKVSINHAIILAIIIYILTDNQQWSGIGLGNKGRFGRNFALVHSRRSQINGPQHNYLIIRRW
jgi:hypothetical protein